MLTIEIWRNGAVIDVVNPESANLDQRISTADSFNAVLPGTNNVANDDELYVYNAVESEDASGIVIRSVPLVGRFVVTDVESSSEADGRVSQRLTCMDKASWSLYVNGTPGDHLIAQVDLSTAANNIADVAYKTSGLPVKFAFVNPDGLNNGVVVTRPRSKRLIKANSTTTLLELLSNIVIPSDSRWRVRTDQITPTIEIGWFGNKRNAFLRGGGKNVVVPTPSTDGVQVRPIFAKAFQYLRSSKDQVNSLYIGGGSWSNAQGSSTELWLWLPNPAPSGYVVTSWGLLDGYTYMRIDKQYDQYGKPYTQRKSKKVVVSTIVPQNTNGLPPSGAQVVDAAQMLLEAGCDYLSSRSLLRETISATISGYIANQMYVGDLIDVSMWNPDGTPVFAGSMYVVGVSSSFDSAGECVTRLELSTILESLVDPLSREYGKTLIAERSKTDIGQYQASVVTTANTGTFIFSTLYAMPPDIVGVSVPSGTASVTYLDNTKVTFNSSLASTTVTFTIVPKY